MYNSYCIGGIVFIADSVGAGIHMTNYKMKGDELHDKTGRKVASLRRDDVLDRNGAKVGSVHGNDIRDKNGNKAASISGNDIRDRNNSRIGTLDEARKAIDGAVGGVSVAALWYFFVR